MPRARRPPEDQDLSLRQHADRILDMIGPVAILDDALRLRRANRAFLETVGLPARGWSGRPLGALGRGVFRKRKLLTLLKTVLTREHAFSDFELEAAPKTGKTRLLRVASRRIPLDSDRNGILLSVEDVTARRTAEVLEAERARAELQREFVANLSHELRTPVAAIRGFAETLLQGGLEDRRHSAGFVEAIQRHAIRLSRLVDDLVEAAARQRGRAPARPETIPLAEFVRTATGDLQPLAKAKRVSLHAHLPAGLTVSADPRDLSHVLQNLLENAIDYNRPGGSVRLSAARARKEVRLRVSDTGIGMTGEEAARIFDRFYRTGRARVAKPSGSGLGLAIVRELVAGMGGRVWAEGRKGKGSTFHVTLPAGRP